MLTDGAVGVPERHWFVAIVEPRHEAKTRDLLISQGHEAFIVARKEMHKWANGQRKEVERVLITCYVFVRLTEAERMQVVALPQVRSFLVNRSATKSPYGRSPVAIVPDAEINTLRTMLSLPGAEVVFTAEHLSVGKQVAVTGFGENSLVATVVKVPRSRKHYVGVRIEGLGCAYMEVPLEQITDVSA